MTQKSFSDTVKMSFKHWTDFKGRAGRREICLYHLAWFMFGAGATVLIVFLDTIISGAGEILSIPLLIGWLAFFVAGISLCVRRLHDLGLSGYWYIAGTLLIMLLGVADHSGSITGLVSLIISAALFFIDSEGDNRFGPSPKNILE